VRILTLNTWGENGPWPQRWDVIFSGVRQWTPEILAFQEVFNLAWAGKIQKHLEGYELIATHAPSGLIFLSRHPVKAWDLFQMATSSPQENCARYAIFIQLQIRASIWSFFNTHLAWRPEESYVRQKQVSELLAYVRDCRRDGPVFLMGDFNADSGTAEIGQILQAGFTDCYAQCHPGQRGLTWSRENVYTRDDRGGGLPDRRLDYIFVMDDDGVCQKALSAAEVVFSHPDERGIFASDHFGVLATLGGP